jgi:murein DD-endopeptidase MepM/ murein hydrolase activator NlpD
MPTPFAIRPSILSLLLYCTITMGATAADTRWYLPINAQDRTSVKELRLTSIGAFGHIRKARPGVSTHLHSGIDILRPGNNYTDEPVFAAGEGTIISMRDDGPLAQVIVMHQGPDDTVWTVYEHIAGISVEPGDRVSHRTTIGRFFNEKELSLYGRQFDHLHFEIMHVAPKALAPTGNLPFRRYASWALQCTTPSGLTAKYHDPMTFLSHYGSNATIPSDTRNQHFSYGASR